MKHQSIQLQASCHDALCYLDLILSKESSINLYSFLLGKNNFSYTDEELFDKIKEESKKFGGFYFFENFNLYQNQVSEPYHSQKNTLSDVAYKIRQEIMDLYLEYSFDIIINSTYKKNNTISNSFDFGHFDYFKKLNSIEKKLDAFINESKKKQINHTEMFSLKKIIDLLNTVHSTIERLSKNTSFEHSKTKKSNYGSAKGLISIGENFDEPLDDFKDYM